MTSECILISSENLKSTGESIDLKCIFCNKETPHKIGYLGMLCLECDLQMFDFDSWHDVYNHIKKKYNLQRKDVAILLNLSPLTVSTYQFNNIGFLTDKLLKLHYDNKIESRVRKE